MDVLRGRRELKCRVSCRQLGAVEISEAPGWGWPLLVWLADPGGLPD